MIFSYYINNNPIKIGFRDKFKLIYIFVFMISILIPVYNYNCSELIRELSAQRDQYDSASEIILMDDGSSIFKNKNEMAARKHGCEYIELPENIGRSAIRNKLAAQAHYDWLIFLDCDSRIPEKDFLKKYLDERNQNRDDVICGGRIFEKKELVGTHCSLHWHCGVYREPSASSSQKRKQFLSNNFMISRELFRKVKFEEQLKEYGHEDTLFGIQLRRRGVDIRYINNPVFHEGLDDNNSFLLKYKKSLSNLKLLKENYLLPEDEREIKILHLYNRISSLKLDGVFAFLYKEYARLAERQLKSKKPNLILFDLYKLGFLCYIMLSDPQQPRRNSL